MNNNGSSSNNNNNSVASWDQFQSTPKLLPPTVFERTTLETNSPVNNMNKHGNLHMTCESDMYDCQSMSQFSLLSNELEKMRLEIKKLHGENENLRGKNKDFVEQAQLYTEASSHRQISITALEEIIHKQTRELQALKSELLTEKEESAQKLKDNEAKLFHKQSEAAKKLDSVESDRKKESETYQTSLAKLRVEHELENKKQNDKIQGLIDENKLLTQKYDSEVTSLKKVIEDLKAEKEARDNKKDEEIKLLNSENSKFLTELQNLRNYVNNSMPTIETVKEMTKEKDSFESQLQKIKNKNEILIKENTSIQIRLKSMNEILSIQEKELESKQLSVGAIFNEKKRQGLLGKWRNKVYELLVQLKSIEINSKQDKNMAEKTLQDYLERLEVAKNRNKICENIIEDKKAEISVIAADNTVLIEQVSILKETNEDLEKQRKLDLQSSVELKNFINSLMKQYHTIEESFKVANKKLLHLDQRVEFAKNRLGVVKALYTHKEAHENKRNNVLDMTTNISSIHGSIDPNNESNFNAPLSLEHNNAQKMEKLEQMDADEENLLRKELELVQEERNLLAGKLQTDMDLMDQKETELKAQYDMKVSVLNEQIEQLQGLNDFKADTIEKINEQLKLKTDAHERLTKKYEDTQKELADLQTQLSSDYESQLKKKDLEYADKMSKMDEKLNDARREQAKAVVIMRQMERSTNREKDRMENLLKSCDTYYKEHLDKLQNKITSLEKERNILMNTLRHQGNITTEDYESLKNLNQSVNKSSLTQSSFNPEVSNCDLEVSISKNESQTEVTSFWLDSKSNTNQDGNEENEEEMNESDMNKNSEILQQIRKIMGNLELSDGEEDKEINDNTSQSQEVTYQDDYQFQTEHAIDDSILKHKNESFSN